MSQVLIYIIHMQGFILTIGDELLKGKIINSNAGEIGQWFTEAGVEVVGCHVLPDEEDLIAQGIKEAFSKVSPAGLVIITGGLGPTRDDKTRQGVAAYLGAGGRKSSKAKKWLEAFLKGKNKEMSPGQALQTWVPSGSMPLQNKWGTACGLNFCTQNSQAFVFPGVPSELKAMFKEYVNPVLPKQGEILEKRVWTWGWPESQQVPALKNWHIKSSQKFSSLPTTQGVVLSLSTQVPPKDKGGERVKNELQTAFDNLLEYVPDEKKVYPVGYEIPAGVVQLLSELKSQVTTAESCTGGAVSFLLTSVSGSSEVFKNGFVTYSNAFKSQVLQVPSKVLDKHGAVSEQTAKAMLLGALQNSGAEYGCATTGIAGPGGGSVAKPVGTVWVAVGSTTHLITKKLQLTGDRDKIRWRAAYTALFLLNQLLWAQLEPENRVKNQNFKQNKNISKKPLHK